MTRLAASPPPIGPLPTNEIRFKSQHCLQSEASAPEEKKPGNPEPPSVAHHLHPSKQQKLVLPPPAQHLAHPRHPTPNRNGSAALGRNGAADATNYGARTINRPL